MAANLTSRFKHWIGLNGNGNGDKPKHELSSNPPVAPIWRAGTRLLDSSNIGRERPYVGLYQGDLNHSIGPWDIIQARSISRKIFYTVSPAQSAILERSKYAFGRAWTPIYTGPNVGWGRLATELLQSEFLPICDAGVLNTDWCTFLHLCSIEMDVSGDILILLTETPNHYPQFLAIPAHRVVATQTMSSDILDSGPFTGYKISNGVITDTDGRLAGYRITEETSSTGYEDVGADDAILVADPDNFQQTRGLPLGVASLVEALDLRSLHELELIAAQISASISLIETNESGSNESGFAERMLQNPPTAGEPPKPVYQENTFFKGMIRYLRAGTGGKIEPFKTDRPSEAWDRFTDRIIRCWCAATGFAYELIWKSDGLTGPTARMKISQAMRSVEDRQDLFRPIAKRMFGYAVAKYIKLGRLPEDPSWYAWDFSMPRSMSIDYGRDAAADLNDWKAGIANQTDIFREQAIDRTQHYTERAMEIVERKLIAQTISKQFGVEISDDEMSLLLPNGQPAPPPDPQKVSPSL
jgi:lambda family portal protein